MGISAVDADAPPIQHPGVTLPKLFDLQILRAVAASLVVVDHILLALGPPARRYVNPALLTGHLGVAAFFILSGLIMVRQSANLFQVRLSPLLFLYRRVARIVPLYWIATVAWVLYFRPHVPNIWGQLANSLFFIPNFLSPADQLTPLLEPGWTLNFEMAFYVLFAAALSLPLRRAAILMLLVLEALTAVGHSHNFPLHHTLPDVLHIYTDPKLLLFAHGILIGLLEFEFRPLPRIAFPHSPAFLLLLPPAVLLAFPQRFATAQLWDLLGFYAMLVVLLCTLAQDSPLGPLRRAFVLLGDASYSTYLFHLWITSRTAHFVAIHRRLSPSRPAAFLVVAIAAILGANILGLAVHFALERPLIGLFRKIRIPAFARAEAKPS